jgi:hypothetical protein
MARAFFFFPWTFFSLQRSGPSVVDLAITMKKSYRQHSPKEFFAILLVQLRNNVFDRILYLWNDHMLYGVNAPVGDLNNFVEYYEGGLEPCLWLISERGHF